MLACRRLVLLRWSPVCPTFEIVSHLDVFERFATVDLCQTAAPGPHLP